MLRGCLCGYIGISDRQDEGAHKASIFLGIPFGKRVVVGTLPRGVTFHDDRLPLGHTRNKSNDAGIFSDCSGWVSVVRSHSKCDLRESRPPEFARW